MKYDSGATVASRAIARQDRVLGAGGGTNTGPEVRSGCIADTSTSICLAMTSNGELDCRMEYE